MNRRLRIYESHIFHCVYHKFFFTFNFSLAAYDLIFGRFTANSYPIKTVREHFSLFCLSAASRNPTGFKIPLCSEGGSGGAALSPPLPSTSCLVLNSFKNRGKVTTQMEISKIHIY